MMKRDEARLCNQPHEVAVDFAEISQNEKRTLWVVGLTATMMVVEIVAGYATGSMALLADGYHMASHAGALGIAYLVYRLARSNRFEGRLNFGTGKLLPLGGYTSAIGLGLIALWMVGESVVRLLNPVAIEINEAIMIAVIGLLVNLASAAILGAHRHDEHDHHHHHDLDHDHDHVHDHNHRSALAHVLADALTSVLAIVALIVGKFSSAQWLDPAMGIVGAFVILRWAYTLCRDTGWELLDAHARGISLDAVKKDMERDGHVVLDLHAWNCGPSNLVCLLSVIPSAESQTDFRGYFESHAKGVHLLVEQRPGHDRQTLR